MTPASSAISGATIAIIVSTSGVFVVLLLIPMVIMLCVCLYWRGRKLKTIKDIELSDNKESFLSSVAPRRPRGMTQIVKANMVIFNRNIRLLDCIGEGNILMYDDYDLSITLDNLLCYL